MSCSLETINTDQTKWVRLAPTGLYDVDGITRRASSLQQTQDAQMDFVKIKVHFYSKKGTQILSNPIYKKLKFIL